MAEDSELVSGRKKVKHEQISVAKLFILACVAGASAIVLGVFFNSPTLAIGLPVLIMGVYIFSTLKLKADVPISIIGDSFYYLGFILTLVALVASLLLLSLNEAVNINSVVGSFGAALITTIIGLISRLVVTSFSVQAKERRERLENEIERSLTSFSEHLESLTGNVVASISKVHGQSEETLRNTLSKYETVHDESLEHYRTSMSSGETALKESMNNLASRIDQIDVPPDVVSKPLTSALEDITNTLAAHHERYAEVNSNLASSNNALSDQFSQSAELIQGHVSSLEEALSLSIEKQAALYEQRLSKMSEGILKSLGNLKNIKFEVEDGVKAKLAGLENEIEHLTKGIRGMVEPIQQTSKEIGENSSQVADELKKLNDAGQRLEVFMESTRSAAVTLAGLQKGLESVTTKMMDLGVQMVEITETSSSAGVKIAAAAEATEDSSEQVAKDIAEVYKQLAIQIHAIKEMT